MKCNPCDDSGRPIELLQFYQLIDGALCKVFACPQCGTFEIETV